MTTKLDAIRQREQAATPGPWYFEWESESSILMPRVGVEGHRRGVGDYAFAVLDDSVRPEQGGAEWDGPFIAASRTDVPLLLAVVDAARRLNVPIEADAGCWYCRGILRTDGMTWWGHETDCPYDALRAALAPLLEPEG